MTTWRLHRGLHVYQCGCVNWQPSVPPEQIGQAFLDAVAYIKAHGYPDWDGTANGQSVTLTACANLMCAVNERVRALQDTNRELNRRVGELMKALNGTTDLKRKAKFRIGQVVSVPAV